MKKNNTWNIRVVWTINPATQRIILKIVGFLLILNSFTLTCKKACREDISYSLKREPLISKFFMAFLFRND